LGLSTPTKVQHNQYANVVNGVPNQIMNHEVGVDDGSVNPPVGINAYIQANDVDLQGGEHFCFIYRIIPDLTFIGSTSGTNPKVLLTLQPRYYPGSAYDAAPSGSVTNTVPAPTPPAQYPVEQYTGVVYTRTRGRQVAFRVESTQVGTAWQLGAMRFDIRPDGRR
jgi:hypothetical protein